MAFRKRQILEHTADLQKPRSFTTATTEAEETDLDARQIEEDIVASRQDARKQPRNWGQLRSRTENTIGLGKLHQENASNIDDLFVSDQSSLQESQSVFDESRNLHQETTLSLSLALERSKGYLACLTQYHRFLGAMLAMRPSESTFSSKPDEFQNSRHDGRQENSIEHHEDPRYNHRTRRDPRHHEEYQESERSDHEYDGYQRQDHSDAMEQTKSSRQKSKPAADPGGEVLLSDESVEDSCSVDDLALPNQERRLPVRIGQTSRSHAVQPVSARSSKCMLVPGAAQVESGAQGRSEVSRDSIERQTPCNTQGLARTRAGQPPQLGEAIVHRPRARPVQTDGPLEKQPVPPFRVRDASNQSWVLPSGISSAAMTMFEQQASTMATVGSQWKHFARLVKRPDRLSTGHCVQCDAIKHKKHECVCSQAYYACDQCMKARRPCAKIIEVDGTMCLGWLPVPDADEDDWQEQSFWVT
ncbi:hypothetical protein EKO04_010983 [Ascochyta lentis]|uniref:Uncharacterized protein n=1 Tax=Ascochyta lentis TaxID=205686 RepID=A0A8H7MCS1_9PLEO|nr:hypothetical protein EKO04_010983 [Ascochyta lentis]